MSERERSGAVCVLCARPVARLIVAEAREGPGARDCQVFAHAWTPRRCGHLSARAPSSAR